MKVYVFFHVIKHFLPRCVTIHYFLWTFFKHFITVFFIEFLIQKDLPLCVGPASSNVVGDSKRIGMMLVVT